MNLSKSKPSVILILQSTWKESDLCKNAI